MFGLVKSYYYKPTSVIYIKMKLPVNIPAKNIKLLSINGMHGRMVHINNKDSDKLIIYIHGLHTMAERHYSLCEYFADYGTVYAPDMPGFGGMDSFYSIGLEPSYENYADYILTFIKSLNIPKDKKLCLIGLSFGTQVMIKLLQRHPEIAERKPQLLSLGGIASYKDMPERRLFRFSILIVSAFTMTRFGNWFMSWFVFNPISFRLILLFLITMNPKYKADHNERRAIYAMEYNLWRGEDHRTHARTAWMLLHTDLAAGDRKKIPLELNDVYIKKDQYVDHKKSAKTMSTIFKKYKPIEMAIDSHAPSLAADKAEVARFLPKEIGKILAS